MKPLVIIPARGGSKGVPGKNIKMLCRKPLLTYTIEAALEVFDSTCVCVSSESDAILQVAKNAGLDISYKRPESLAQDTSTTDELVQHALGHFEKMGYFADTVVLLQPTSPFRSALHIKAALNCFDDSCDMVVSVKETKANPYYTLMEEDAHGWLVKSKKHNATRRQDLPAVFEINGAIYIIKRDALHGASMHHLLKIKKFVMDEISSHDIDTLHDWYIAELICANLL